MRLALAALLLASSAFARKTLVATPETVVWAYYNGAAKPALTINSGDAYSLVSVVCDVDITQLVDLPHVGVHVICPKNLFTPAKH